MDVNEVGVFSRPAKGRCYEWGGYVSILVEQMAIQYVNGNW